MIMLSARRHQQLPKCMPPEIQASTRLMLDPVLWQVFDKAAAAIGATFTELPKASGEVRRCAALQGSGHLVHVHSSSLWHGSCCAGAMTDSPHLRVALSHTP